MKKSNLLLFWSLIFFVFSYVNTVTYANGDRPPERIISLAPVITEELYLLGVDDKIVGVTTYCQRPPDAQKKEKIGTVIKPNIEKIVSLKPDLVLGLSMMNLKQLEKLKKLRMRVVRFSQPKDFSEICNQFLKLGEIVHREDQAAKIVDIAKNKVDSIKNEVKELQKPKVFIQIGARPLVTVNKDSFINDFIELAGGINIASGIKTGLYTPEEVLRKNPDVIIIVTMGITGEEEKKTWQRYKTLNATKNNQIYIIDSYKICSPTPPSFVEALEEIIKFVHAKDKI